MLQLYPRSVVFSITPVVLPIGEPPRNITPLKGTLPGSKKSAGQAARTEQKREWVRSEVPR